MIARIDDENERSRRFMHKGSYDKVTKLCQNVMVNAHKERLYAVCHEFIESERMNGMFLINEGFFMPIFWGDV